MDFFVPPSLEGTSCVVSHFSHICFAFEINICFAFQSLFLANCFAFQSVSYFSLFRILDKLLRILVNSVLCFLPRFVSCFVPCSTFQPEPKEQEVFTLSSFQIGSKISYSAKRVPRKSEPVAQSKL